MIDWTHKLTSRKFWLALIGFLTPVMVVLGYDELSTEQMQTLVLSLGTLVAYILGESYIDGNLNHNNIAENSQNFPSEFPLEYGRAITETMKNDLDNNLNNNLEHKQNKEEYKPQHREKKGKKNNKNQGETEYE